VISEHDETFYVRIDTYHFDSRIFCLDRQLIKNSYGLSKLSEGDIASHQGSNV